VLADAMNLQILTEDDVATTLWNPTFLLQLSLQSNKD
jgi:hypothetical protein